MTENSNLPFQMPVMPAYGGGYGGDMMGGGFAWWIIILLIFGGWGNGGWGGFGSNNGVGSEVQRGFDQNAVMNGLTGIQNAVTNGFQNAETAAASRQIAQLQQDFAMQSAFQNCCCENRMATADLKYTVANEACADRNAISMALRDVLEANAVSTQRILDTMCQDKIDAKNETIAQLRQQIQMQQLAASQNAQTAAIVANNEAQTFALEQYLAPVPKPAYIVQNPNCCQQSWGYGCGNV
jgi:hypothetical protein